MNLSVYSVLSVVSFMQYEVEQKHPVEDERALFERLAERGVEVGPRVEQMDHYFAHPARDFARTDEALRIRTVGDKSFVTYKGPKVDTATKTRREIELPLPSGNTGAAQFAELLTALGFTLVAEVRKSRTPVHLAWQGRTVEAALDDVAGVGAFVELETAADEAELDAAKSCLASLAKELKLTTPERRSYLEMLLSKRE